MKITIEIDINPAQVKQILEPSSEGTLYLKKDRLEIVFESDKLSTLRGKTNALFKALKVIENIEKLE